MKRLKQGDILYDLLDALFSVSDVLMLVTQTLIVGFGVPLILVLLSVVEQHRVYDGLMVFISNQSWANFAASAAVMMNVVMEFYIVHIEQSQRRQQDDIELPDEHIASLRLFWRSTKYRLGIGHFEARKLPPAYMQRRLARGVQMMILVLALGGSMWPTIVTRSTVTGIEEPAPWHVTILDIIQNSSMSEMTTWILGLVFSYVIVRVVPGLARFIALNVSEVRTYHARQTKNREKQTTDDRPRLSERTDKRQPSVDSDRLVAGASGYRRDADAANKVSVYLDSNPDHAQMSSRKLARMVGVGHDSANKYRNEWVSARGDIEEPVPNGSVKDDVQ